VTATSSDAVRTSDASTSGARGAAGLLDAHYHLLRRLHSLTGIVPIGVFLIAHLTTNSSILWGKFALRGEHSELTLREGGVAYFWKEVKWINEQIPHLLLIEIVLWASIAFHSILGVYYAKSGRANVARYAYQDNWRYTLQRVSGYIGILFIFYHVATLRWGWTWLIPPFDGSVSWSHDFSASTLAQALRGGENPTLWGVLVSAFYFVGVSLLVFHFANGLWTSAITWGLTVSRTAQRRWGLACAALGVGLMGMAWASVVGFAMLSPQKAREVELKLQEKAPALLEADAPAIAPAPAPARVDAR
jgi:succinate dehydrogenase / fumarate reductase cytochrome b subunit